MACIRGDDHRVPCVARTIYVINACYAMARRCGAVQNVELPEGRFTPPTKCLEDSCRSRTFTANKATAKCEDWQKVGGCMP